MFLGLDLGTHLGYCLLNSSGKHVASGTKVIMKGKERHPQRLQNFNTFLSELWLDHRFEYVRYEQAAFAQKSKDAHRVYYSLEAVLILWASSRNISFADLHLSTLKKFATGKGNAKKHGVFSSAVNWKKEEGLSIELIDDNHTDAIALARYAHAKHQGWIT